MTEAKQDSDRDEENRTRIEIDEDAEQMRIWKVEVKSWVDVSFG